MGPLRELPISHRLRVRPAQAVLHGAWSPLPSRRPAHRRAAADVYSSASTLLLMSAKQMGVGTALRYAAICSLVKSADSKKMPNVSKKSR